MADQQPPRTRLGQLLRQQHLTLEEFRKRYERTTGAELSERQAYRWVVGELRGLPYPQAQAALEQLFGEPVARLLGPPYGAEAIRPTRRHNEVVTERGTARTDWEGQIIAMSADRARDFLTRIEGSNVGAETLDQLIDDLRRLVTVYQQQSLPTLLGDLVDTQDRAFGLLEGRQRPEQVQPDELDSLGGLCTFSRARQLYYAADALAWGGDKEASHTERLALEALDAYADAPDQDRAFGDESGTRSALAVARVLRREIDGAAEALAPVLELPPPKRIHGIVASVEHVRTALRSVKDPGRDVTELAGAIEGFTSERLALQR